ncbi:MAG: sulfotransferase family protein [Thiobacillus sp.]
MVGTPRSGTTLMAKVLGRHSRLFMPGETHFFDDVYAARESLGDLKNAEARNRVAAKLADHYRRYWEKPDQERVDRIIHEQPEEWANWRDGMRDYRDALSGFMEMQMEVEAKARWGNNAPRDIFNIEEILAFYPQAKFVVCVRDPRDFLLSYKGKWKIVTDEEYVDRMRKLYHPVITSLLWKSSMRQLAGIKAKVPAGNWIVARYEDLVNAPEDTVRRICAVVEEVFEPQMLEVEESNSSTGQQQKGIFATSVQRWRTELTPAEIAVAQRITRGEMQELGYQQEAINASMLDVAGAYLGAPFAFVRAMRANAEMRGPLIPYLARRVKSLISS